MVGSSCMMFCSICQWGMVPDISIRSLENRNSLGRYSVALVLCKSSPCHLQGFCSSGTGIYSCEATELTESALNGIKLLYNIIPGLFSLACLITLLYYKLGVKQYNQILSELNKNC